MFGFGLWHLFHHHPTRTSLTCIKCSAVWQAPELRGLSQGEACPRAHAWSVQEARQKRVTEKAAESAKGSTADVSSAPPVASSTAYEDTAKGLQGTIDRLQVSTSVPFPDYSLPNN